ncbi:molybdopterin-dependent oxidoreductase [Gloeobacter kilaueensis]|uniref:Formate dehydrogenase, alpha subunit n=1 Tax=Gloeobacter kilaueensis (strain ATCC BAA-2537 / CCAP 1431/1 / ULC 316 / JS1) TaxID=1183438 RepID=U5QN05_GLOK1|nr:molybdopterin-dependent oxidoreductase [Gloeobacter kilaueensis]AGY60283.1 formate dehydrogenase, alpha subunit [Gloeobacter kilaueensis JS1]
MRRREVLWLAGLGLGANSLPARSQLLKGAANQTAPGGERLLSPLYRAAGTKNFTPIAWNKAWMLAGEQMSAVRAASWSPALRRVERLGFYLDSGLTNEEAYAWAKLARLTGGRLERRGEKAALAVARALDTSFGVPAATNHWLELPGSKAILIVGSPHNGSHPAYKSVQAAIQAGAKVWQLSEGGTTPGVAGNSLVLSPGSTLAVLGGLIRYIVVEKRADLGFLDIHTNAAFQLQPEFDFKGGLFSGFDPKTRRYDPDTWGYQYLEGGKPARAEQLSDRGTVYDRLASFYAPYTPALVARIAGVSEGLLVRCWREWTAPEQRPASVVYSLDEAVAPELVEQQVRAAAIVSLLTAQVGRPGGGIVLVAPGRNFQGSADVGALGGMLSGWCGAPPLPNEDLVGWVQRWGLRGERRLIPLLRSWYDTNQPDFGFSLLGTAAQADLPLRDSRLDVLVCVGSDPLRSEDWPLEALKLLVVLDSDATNRTARFWQSRPAAGTAVLFLPLAHPSEREGTITDTGRRIQAVKTSGPPQGKSQTGLALATALWNQLSNRLATSSEPRDRALRFGRWWSDPTPAAVFAELANPDLRTLEQVDEAAQPQQFRTATAIYAGASYEALQGRQPFEDSGGLGLYPGYGYLWPGNVHVIANRASADLEGKSRIEPPFMQWDGRQWTGPDTPDIPNADKPAAPAATRSFRGTPEGVARLFAASYALGLNLDTGIAFLNAPTPALGPLPLYYVPRGSRRSNPLYPTQPEAPSAFS